MSKLVKRLEILESNIDMICRKLNLEQVEQFRDKSNLTFGQALEFIKENKKVTRSCWNNMKNNLWLFHADSVEENYIVVETVRGITVPWIPNHSEMLANDWLVIEY